MVGIAIVHGVHRPMVGFRPQAAHAQLQRSLTWHPGAAQHGAQGRVDLVIGKPLIILVGGLKHFLFFHILGIIIPSDFHIFQRGGSTTNQYLYVFYDMLHCMETVFLLLF